MRILALAGVPMEVMGLMLGEFVDDYTVRVVDVSEALLDERKILASTRRTGDDLRDFLFLNLALGLRHAAEWNWSVSRSC